MRVAAGTTALTDSVKKHFPDDVAAAFAAGDESMLDLSVRHHLADVSDGDEVDRIVQRIATATSDSTLDWLVGDAESPWAWMYAQLRDSL